MMENYFYAKSKITGEVRRITYSQMARLKRDEWEVSSKAEYEAYKATMNANKPTEIRADQWSTIAADVAAGRCEVTFVWPDEPEAPLTILFLKEGLVFEYRSGTESGVLGLEPTDVLQVRWLPSQPDGAAVDGEMPVITGLSMLTREGGSKSVYFAYPGAHEVVLDTLDYEREIADLKAESESRRVALDEVRAEQIAEWKRAENAEAESAIMRRVALDAVSVAIASLVADDPAQFISNSPDLQRAKEALSSTTAGAALLKERDALRAALEIIASGVNIVEKAERMGFDLTDVDVPVIAFNRIAEQALKASETAKGDGS